MATTQMAVTKIVKIVCPTAFISSPLGGWATGDRSVIFGISFSVPAGRSPPRRAFEVGVVPAERAEESLFEPQRDDAEVHPVPVAVGEGDRRDEPAQGFVLQGEQALEDRRPGRRLTVEERGDALEQLSLGPGGGADSTD